MERVCCSSTTDGGVGKLTDGDRRYDRCKCFNFRLRAFLTNYGLDSWKADVTIHFCRERRIGELYAYTPSKRSIKRHCLRCLLSQTQTATTVPLPGNVRGHLSPGSGRPSRNASNSIRLMKPTEIYYSTAILTRIIPILQGGAGLDQWTECIFRHSFEVTAMHTMNQRLDSYPMMIYCRSPDQASPGKDQHAWLAGVQSGIIKVTSCNIASAKFRRARRMRSQKRDY